MTRLDLPHGAPVPIRVEDLGITVHPGSPSLVSPEAARNSACLRVLVAARAVVATSTSEKTRPDMTPRSPTVHSVAMTRPGRAVAPPVSPPLAPPAPPPKPETDLREVIRAVLEEMDVAGLVEKAIQRALPRVIVNAAPAVTPDAAPRVATPFDEPVYIPSDIVAGDSPVVAVSSGMTDAGDLDQAASALRSIRSSQRRRTGGKDK